MDEKFSNNAADMPLKAETGHVQMGAAIKSNDFKIDRLTEIVMNSDNGQSLISISASPEDAEKKIRDAITEGIGGKNNTIYGIAMNLVETRDSNLAHILSEQHLDFGIISDNKSKNLEVELLQAQSMSSKGSLWDQFEASQNDNADRSKKAFENLQREEYEEENEEPDVDDDIPDPIDNEPIDDDSEPRNKKTKEKFDVKKEKFEKKADKLGKKADKFELKADKANLKKLKADSKVPTKRNLLLQKKKLKMGQRNLGQKLAYQSMHQPKKLLKNALKAGAAQDGLSYDSGSADVLAAGKKGLAVVNSRVLKPFVRKHTALGFDRQQYLSLKFEKKNLKFEKKSLKNKALSAYNKELAKGVKGSNPISRAAFKKKLKTKMYQDYGYKKSLKDRIKDFVSVPVKFVKAVSHVIMVIINFFGMLITTFMGFLSAFGLPLLVILLLCMFGTFFAGLVEEDDRVTLTRESAIYVNYVASLEHSLVSAVNNNEDWDKKEKDSDTGFLGLGRETMWDYTGLFPDYDKDLFGEADTHDGYGTKYTKGDVYIDNKSLLNKPQRTSGSTIWNPEYLTYEDIGKGDFPSIDAANKAMNQVKFIAYVTAKYMDDLTVEDCRTEARNILYDMYTVNETYTDVPSYYYKYEEHTHTNQDTGQVYTSKDVVSVEYTYHKLNLSISMNGTLDDFIKNNLDKEQWDMYQLYTGVDPETGVDDGSGSWGLGQLIDCPVDLGGTDWRTKVSSTYGTRTIGALHYEMERDEPEFHKGIDIGCPTGTPLIAGAAGTVLNTGYDAVGGYVMNIVIDDPGSDGKKLTLHYVHCSDMYVSAGDSVAEGQVIGLSGATGSGAGASGSTDSNGHYISDGRPHLHFSIYMGGDVTGDPLNPMFYIELPDS